MYSASSVLLSLSMDFGFGFDVVVVVCLSNSSAVLDISDLFGSFPRMWSHVVGNLDCWLD